MEDKTFYHPWFCVICVRHYNKEPQAFFYRLSKPESPLALVCHYCKDHNHISLAEELFYPSILDYQNLLSEWSHAYITKSNGEFFDYCKGKEKRSGLTFGNVLTLFKDEFGIV